MTTIPPSFRPATLLVHGGVQRSQFGETAEALFLTSGFVYDSAEQAEATFAGTVEHYQYSRFGNPTVSMLEERLACSRAPRPAAPPPPAWPRCMPRCWRI